MDIVIANWDEEDLQMNPTHAELNKTSFLSNLARTIPLPDFNQSPRNMYQCQMGKQTMATPTHTWHLNAETKMYRLQTPTSPLFRPYHYDAVDLDHYPMGTNAIVAVISYTGYDMEDAMIINRASIERGFAYGTVYKSYFIDLFTIVGGRKPKNPSERESGDLVFERDPQKHFLAKFLDSDGLPLIGTRSVYLVYLGVKLSIFMVINSTRKKFVKTLCATCQVKRELRFHEFFKDKVFKKKIELEKFRENTVCQLSKKI